MHGLPFAVAIVRFTNKLVSDECRGKRSSIGLWVVGSRSTFSCISQHNLHSNLSIPTARAKDRYPCLLRRLRARPINDDRDGPVARVIVYFANGG